MEKILIISPSWIGDMVMSQSLFKLLKEHSDCEIHVAAPAWCLYLTEFMPEVSKAIPLPFVHGKFDLRARYNIAKKLKKEKYDRSIVLPNSFKSALVPFFAGIKRRCGFVGESRYFILNDCRKLDKSALPLMVERFLYLAEFKKVDYKKYRPKFIINNNLHQSDIKNKKILAICPGAEFGPSKRWPAECFAQVSNKMLNDGWDVWIFGGKNDIEIADKINMLTKNRCNDLAGRTTLKECCELISSVDFIISNDTGLMHIGAAFDKKMIVIYGSTSPEFTPPLTDNATILSSDLACSPCFQRECKFGHYNCMRGISILL